MAALPRMWMAPPPGMPKQLPILLRLPPGVVAQPRPGHLGETVAEERTRPIQEDAVRVMLLFLVSAGLSCLAAI